VAAVVWKRDYEERIAISATKIGAKKRIGMDMC
jgi:hypothetical protein